VKNKSQFEKHATFLSFFQSFFLSLHPLSAANQISQKISHIVQLSKIRLPQNQEVFQQSNMAMHSHPE
jgi:hypothetical protein